MRRWVVVHIECEGREETKAVARAYGACLMWDPADVSLGKTASAKIVGVKIEERETETE